MTGASPRDTEILDQFAAVRARHAQAQVAPESELPCTRQEIIDAITNCRDRRTALIARVELEAFVPDEDARLVRAYLRDQLPPNQSRQAADVLERVRTAERKLLGRLQVGAYRPGVSSTGQLERAVLLGSTGDLLISPEFDWSRAPTKRRFGVLDWDVSARTSQGVELSIRLNTSHSVEPGWTAWLGAGRQPSQYDSVVRAAVSEAVTAVVAGITVEGMIATRKDVEREVLARANERLVGQPCRLELISFMGFSDNQGYIEALGRRLAANRKQEPITDS